MGIAKFLSKSKAAKTNPDAIKDEKAYYVWMATGGFIVPWNGTSGNGCDVQTMDEC